ncbi:hypothetical protein KVR01_002393 [Diaporthe batatas]|uniref:uncharacterized protein n=1 Tax=Diaporthe batatas TaxID=748121 RepID=UPI001D04F6FE|nr:uncharacterized protein KVR01_002393 [Diaporthe batatas]KAG8166704.1 hypothetical protein KVR01_002393 [Diaporthe batatas]
MEEEYLKRATVSPHWLDGGNSFWYRRHLSAGKSEFTLVDCVNQTRGPAFNHEALADALRSRSESAELGQDIGPNSLPFTWIEFSPDGSSIGFVWNKRKWGFSLDKGLIERDGNFVQARDQLLTKERPSRPGSQATTVTFANHTDGPLSLFWIDFDSKAKLYEKISQGKTREQRTYAGHVWKLVNEETKQTKAIYVAPDESEDYIVIDESTMTEEKAKDGDGDDDDDTGAIESKGQDVNRERVDPMTHNISVAGNNVWLTDDEGHRTKLSSDGTMTNPYDGDKVFASPDKKFVVVWQYTPEEYHVLHLRESAPEDQLEPNLRTVPYLKPGDRVRVDRPRLFDLDSRCEVPTSDLLFDNPYKIKDVGWDEGSSEYRFIFNERGHQKLRLIGMKTTGEVRTLIEESSETFVDYSSKLYHRLVDGTDSMLWFSERDGFNHIYFFDLKSGQLRNQVTKGQWNVHSVTHVDEEKRQIWFQGYGMVAGQDPYHAHLARVDFDGKDFRVLTKGDGDHQWTLSPGHRYFTDTWSRVDLPPRCVLRDLETGDEIQELEGGADDIELLLAKRWVAPERFTAPGRDSETAIYGLIIRPSGFDASKRYPIIEDIYAGPHGFHTPKKFSTLSKQRKWADQGYVVVMLDGMGTNWRSKRFHDVCHKNLKDAGLPDRIAWITAAAGTRPWMDRSRVGIMGGSAGGQSAVAALIHHGGFYKAAVADSGCHDNRMDKIWWNEQWMGYPVDESS